MFRHGCNRAPYALLAPSRSHRLRPSPTTCSCRISSSLSIFFLPATLKFRRALCLLTTLEISLSCHFLLHQDHISTTARQLDSELSPLPPLAFPNSCFSCAFPPSLLANPRPTNSSDYPTAKRRRYCDRYLPFVMSRYSILESAGERSGTNNTKSHRLGIDCLQRQA